MAQEVSTWWRSSLILLLCLEWSGCSPFFAFYPVGPVTQNFACTCNGRRHEIVDEAVKACFGGLDTLDNLLLAKRNSCISDCKATGENDAAKCNDKIGSAKSECLKITEIAEALCISGCPRLLGLDHALLRESGTQEEACDPSKSSPAESCVDTALKCAAATRDSYADFLNCREYFQTGAGVGIAALAAAAAPVTVGASAVAGVALAGAAVGGLGLDYIVHNSLKSAAYATAATQLQCVIYDSSNIGGTLKPLQEQQSKLAHISDCKPESMDEYHYLMAENAIANKQVQFLDSRYKFIGRDVFATTRNIDVRAFSIAQNGVPSGSTIQSALQAETSALTSILKAPQPLIS